MERKFFEERAKEILELFGLFGLLGLPDELLYIRYFNLLSQLFYARKNPEYRYSKEFFGENQ